MSSQSVVDIIDAARALMPIRKRGADGELYDALVLALRAAELCIADINHDIELGKVIASLPRGEKNRQYVERGSDAYQRVCRYVFFGEEHTANINRYAIAIRQAAKQGVTSAQLLARLRHGGINQFYLTRPLQSRNISTRCIRLDRQITHDKFKSFTLELKRNDDNSYSILSSSIPVAG